MRDCKLDPSMTQNFLTGTLLDYLLSTPGGLPKAANYLVLGDPGSGKSTISFDMAANIQIGYPDARVLVIEAEMNALETAPFAYRFPKIAALPILFVGGGIQGSSHTCQSLVNTRRRGWDVVVIDSLEKVCSIICYEEGWPSTKAMLWVLSLIKQHCCGVNVRKVPTSFLTIQQVTKNGTARGSNIIMHDASAVMYLKLSSLTNQYSDRYVYLGKNRRGFVNFPLFYDIVSGGDVTFDVERYDDECDKREIRSHAGEAIIQIRSALDDIFDVPEDQN